jgi:hypothetical protein
MPHPAFLGATHAVEDKSREGLEIGRSDTWMGGAALTRVFPGCVLGCGCGCGGGDPAQAAKKLLKKEFAQLMMMDWIKRGDTRVVERYLDTSMGDIDINMHSGKVRCGCCSRLPSMSA